MPDHLDKAFDISRKPRSTRLRHTIHLSLILLNRESLTISEWIATAPPGPVRDSVELTGTTITDESTGETIPGRVVVDAALTGEEIVFLCRNPDVAYRLIDRQDFHWQLRMEIEEAHRLVTLDDYVAKIPSPAYVACASPGNTWGQVSVKPKDTAKTDEAVENADARQEAEVRVVRKPRRRDEQRRYAARDRNAETRDVK